MIEPFDRTWRPETWPGDAYLPYVNARYRRCPVSPQHPFGAERVMQGSYPTEIEAQAAADRLNEECSKRVPTLL